MSLLVIEKLHQSIKCKSADKEKWHDLTKRPPLVSCDQAHRNTQDTSAHSSTFFAVQFCLRPSYSERIYKQFCKQGESLQHKGFS